MSKQLFDDFTGGVVTPRGTVYFEDGVLILPKQKKPKKKKKVSHTKIKWQKLDDKNYRQNLETAKCDDYTLSLVLHTDEEKKK